jgi:hypothetical protein
MFVVRHEAKSFNKPKAKSFDERRPKRSRPRSYGPQGRLEYLEISRGSAQRAEANPECGAAKRAKPRA